MRVISYGYKFTKTDVVGLLVGAAIITAINLSSPTFNWRLELIALIFLGVVLPFKGWAIILE